MKINLEGPWALAAWPGQPCRLLNRITGETFTPGDYVEIYPGAWRLAGAAVEAMRPCTLKDEDERLFRLFLGAGTREAFEGEGGKKKKKKKRRVSA